MPIESCLIPEIAIGGGFGLPKKGGGGYIAGGKTGSCPVTMLGRVYIAGEKTGSCPVTMLGRVYIAGGKTGSCPVAMLGRSGGAYIPEGKTGNCPITIPDGNKEFMPFGKN